MRVAMLSCCVLLAACGSSSTATDMAVTVINDLSMPDVDAGPSECDVLSNTGCPAGDKCTIGTDDGAPRDICFPVAAAPVALGGDCMSVTMGKRVGDNCAAGLSCITYFGEGAKCRAPCYIHSDCPAGSGCFVVTISNTTRTDEGGTNTLRACHVDDGCDPVAQTVCTSPKACYLSGADDVGRYGVCLMPTKMGMDGDDCANLGECAPGFRCDLFGFCRRYCYYETAGGGIPTTGQCPSGEGTCQLFPDEDDQYGICGAL